jgi:hypothetical protein
MVQADALNRMPSSGLAATRSQDEVDAGQSQDVTIRPASSRFEELKGRRDNL